MKRILTLVAMVLTATLTYAQQITEQAAMERALQYMNSQMPAQVSRLRAPARGGSIKLEPALSRLRVSTPSMLRTAVS